MPTNAKPRSPALRIRPLRQGDLDDLMELYSHANWTVQRRRRDVARMLAGTPFMLSAWMGKRLVGFCRVLTDFVYRAVLYDVIVHPDLQRRGVGRTLIAKALAHPRLRKIPSWYLKTEDKHAFYEKFGWAHDAQRFMELKR